MALSRELSSRTRILMPLAERGVTDVPLLGRYNYTSARPGLSDHTHQEAIEICFLVKGRQTYRVGDEVYRLNGGDVFLTLPGEEHGTGGFPEEKGVLYWLVIEVHRRRKKFLGLPQEQATALLQALTSEGPRHFRGSWKMKEHLDAITSIFHRSPDPLQAFAMANQVGALLLLMITSARESPARGHSHSLSSIQHYIERHLGEPLSIPQLAAQAGLSTARFKAWFKQEAGIPPGEYIARAKIEEAQRRLKQGDANITEIAFDLGFSTSQYFATMFKRFTGRTPSSTIHGA